MHRKYTRASQSIEELNFSKTTFFLLDHHVARSNFIFSEVSSELAIAAQFVYFFRMARLW
jgi:hypothetical protein